MEKILDYIKNNWKLFIMGGAFLIWFIYLTFSGNQFCDCIKTESYRDGTTKSHSRTGYYRFYHK